MIEQLRYYVRGQAASIPTYFWEQFWLTLFGWIPTVAGIGLRALAYRLIMRVDGWPAIVFSGWPNTSYGTYGGVVFAIDNFISEFGNRSPELSEIIFCQAGL